MSDLTPQSAFAISMYNDRALGYDAANGGWHVDLANDFIKWVKPKSGDAVLDLACGTGLVSIAAATAVGESGIVVGVDITSGMLAEARKKSLQPGSASIEWVEQDVTNLGNVEAVQRVLSDRGGFDILSCCSALYLLPNAVQVIKGWAGLLKVGGRMIIDVPTEDKTLQNLFTGDLRRAVGIPLPFNRNWVTDINALEKLYGDAGLEIEQSFRTKSYFPECWYEEGERDAVFDAQMKIYPKFEQNGKVDQAREVFQKLWKEYLRPNGRFWDGHALYVTIGKKV